MKKATTAKSSQMMTKKVRNSFQESFVISHLSFVLLYK